MLKKSTIKHSVITALCMVFHDYPGGCSIETIMFEIKSYSKTANKNHVYVLLNRLIKDGVITTKNNECKFCGHDQKIYVPKA